MMEMAATGRSRANPPSSQRTLESPWEGKLKQESRNLKLQGWSRPTTGSF